MGTSGTISLKPIRPRFHQMITSNAAGREQVTVLQSNAAVNKPSAAKYHFAFLFPASIRGAIGSNLR